MTRYFAFLRAINVGGHTVKMEALRRNFEELGFAGVETFIASGNVIFETGNGPVTELENRIEAGLAETLGFKPVVFLRTLPELTQIVACQPFPEEQFARATAFVLGREMFWLCEVRQSESKFANTVGEKALGQPATMHQVSTMQRLVDKYKK